VSEYNPVLAVAEQEGELSLSSPAFDDGERIPDEFGRRGENVNPALEIDGVPEDAKSLLLVVDDPDAVEPTGKIWVHWLVWKIPPQTEMIPRALDPSEAVEGENDSGEVGYGGPNPPKDPHMYRFKLYALDTELRLPRGASAEDVSDAMSGHVIAQTQLTGTFAP